MEQNNNMNLKLFKFNSKLNYTCYVNLAIVGARKHRAVIA